MKYAGDTHQWLQHDTLTPAAGKLLGLKQTMAGWAAIIIHSCDYDLTMRALSTNASTYAELTALRFLKNRML